MSSLILDSLEIRNFRAFRHLNIERLVRINLIVGENNVGKTTLLEALHLYARRGAPSLIVQLLQARDEIALLHPSGRDNELEESIQAIKNLFYGYPDDWYFQEMIQIGSPNKTSDMLTLSLGMSQSHFDEEHGLRVKLIKEHTQANGVSPSLVVQVGTPSKPSIFPLDSYLRRKWIEFRNTIPHSFIPVDDYDNRQLEKLWDKVALTELEKDVLDFLRIIAPDIQGLTFVNRSHHNRERIPKVKVAKFAKPISLRSIGQGITRLFAIALGLMNAKDGLLLIDEFDSTLYYDYQPDVWRMIFDIALRLNVQVFATTHSWDCIEAFERAGYENKQVEGLLFSLRNKKGKPGEVVAILYDEQELEIATHAQIEVR